MKKLFFISLLIGNVALADNYGTPAVFKCNCPQLQKRYQNDGFNCSKKNILITNYYTTPMAIIPENNPSKPIGCELIK